MDRVGYSHVCGLQWNIAAPKSREMRDVPLSPQFFLLSPLFLPLSSPFLPPPPDCRPGRSAPFAHLSGVHVNDNLSQ